MLHNENKYIKDFKTIIDKVPQNCGKFQMVIHADKKPSNGHRWCYNAATCRKKNAGIDARETLSNLVTF